MNSNKRYISISPLQSLLFNVTVLRSMIDALLYHGMREWSPRGVCGRTRDFRSRDGACRGLARRRQAPPLAPTPGAHHAPGLPALSSSRTSSHATFLACHESDRAPFSLQTPVERSERLAGCWAVRARANPLSLGVWHFTLRFVLPGSRVGYPRPQQPKGEAGPCSHPLDPKSTQRSILDLDLRLPFPQD